LRFLDIGVAALVGASSIIGLMTWSPRNGDSISSQLALQAQLRDGMVSYLDSRGLPWMMKAPSPELCAGLLAAVPRAEGVFVEVGSRSCGDPPPMGAVVANLTLGT
jgi:hypothetical protein